MGRSLKPARTSYKWMILFLVCIATFSTNYNQFILTPLATRLMDMYGITAAQFTAAFTVPLIPGALLSVAVGMMADRCGVERMVSVGYAIATLGVVWRIFAADYATLMASMVVVGIGAAALNANSGKIFGSWFPPQQVSTMVGIFLAASTLAKVVAVSTTALLPGVRAAYTICAVISAGVTLLWIVFIRVPQCPPGPHAAPPKAENSSAGRDLARVLRCRPVWLAGIGLMFLAASYSQVTGLLPAALMTRGIGEVSAGVYGSVIMVGNLFGSLMAPAMAARLGRNKPLMLAFAVIAGTGCAVAWLFPVGLPLVAALFITGFANNGLLALLLSTPVQLPQIGPRLAGTAGGVASTLHLAGGAILPGFVLAPLAGSNIHLLFALSGGLCIVVAAACLLLPELGEKGTAHKDTENDKTAAYP